MAENSKLHITFVGATLDLGDGPQSVDVVEVRDKNGEVLFEAGEHEPTVTYKLKPAKLEDDKE
ncbi:hypothetical protein [Amycolatopsis sp. NPDC003731]